MYDVMILGNKTLELLKCLVLINMWYNTPEMYHHQKAHLITHMCITMAFDLGLGGYSTGAASSGPSLRYNMGSVESRNGKNGGHSTDEDSNSAGGLYNHSDNASVASSDVSSMTGSRSESVSIFLANQAMRPARTLSMIEFCDLICYLIHTLTNVASSG